MPRALRCRSKQLGLRSEGLKGEWQSLDEERVWEIQGNSKGFSVHILCSCAVHMRKRGNVFIKQFSITY